MTKYVNKSRWSRFKEAVKIEAIEFYKASLLEKIQTIIIIVILLFIFSSVLFVAGMTIVGVVFVIFEYPMFFLFVLLGCMFLGLCAWAFNAYGKRLQEQNKNERT